MELLLRTQTELRDDLQAIVNDADPVDNRHRYTEPNLLRSINRGLRDWYGRVSVPFVHDMEWDIGTTEYDLPTHVQPPIEAYQRRYRFGFNLPDADTLANRGWTELHSYEVVPRGDGSNELNVAQVLFSAEGFIVHWGINGDLPLSTPNLVSAIDDEATALEVNIKFRPGLNGYVEIGNEVVGYGGYTETASGLQLTNLRRGLMGTTAAGHSEGADVGWCVVAHDGRLFNQLMDNAARYLHLLYMQTGGAGEKDTHGQMIRYYKEEAENFWRTYTPMRRPKMVLTERARGPLPAVQWVNYLTSIR